MVNEIRGRVWPGRFATFLALLWILFVALGAQAAGWLAPGLGWRPDTLNAPVQTAIVQALLVIVPLGLLARFWRGPRYRAIFGLWFGAGLFALCLAPTRLLASTQGQVIMLLQWLIMAIFFVVVRHMLQGERRRLIDLDALLPALIGSALFAIPWLALGALGSMLDIIISLLAALFFGLTASALIDGVWLRSLTLDRRGAARDLFTGGVVIGVTLLLMGSGLAFNGMQLLLMVALSAWGWFVMGLTSMGQPYGSSRNSLAVALFVALAAAAPLLLIDSDSMLFEALDPGALRAWRAIVPVALLGWVLGVILLFAHDRVMDMRPTRLGLVGVGTCWLLGLLVFAGIGQPGFYGDRLFVVMAEQIDVSAAASIADYDERRKQVYISLVEHAEQEQADLRRLLDRFGVAYRPYYLVNGLEVQGGLLARLWLSTRNDVARVLYNPILRPIDGPPPTNKGVEPAPDGLEWNLTSIGADRVWSDFGVRGQGIVIGQSDSGVDATHPELESSYRGRGDDHDYNWLDPWYDSRAPVDWNGHGTHTLGSVLGAGVGVAPGADWFGCANLARNLGNPARYLDCMQFMLAPHPQAGDPFHDGDPTRSAHVTNNSWGCPGQAEGCDALTMQSAVAAMRAAGIFTVV
jgi:hypothetical protein